MEFFCMLRARTLHCHTHAIVLFPGGNPKCFCISDRGMEMAGLPRIHTSRAHTRTLTYAGESRDVEPYLPCQSLSEPTQAAVSGVVEHPPAAPARKELHNLGQGCWLHLSLEEGVEKKRPRPARSSQAH